MDHTDDFSQNWRIINNDDRPLDEASIEAFIAEHGIDQAKGYLRAIQHMITELEFATYDTRPDIGRGTRPLTRIKNNIKKLLLHKENFLSYTQSDNGIFPKGDPQKP